jgi:ribosomal protein L3 glutamine methyltransferase
MVAQANIETYELGHRVKTVCSDLFAEVEGQYQLIVSNPPYVDQQDLASMPAEFHHEPSLALESGDDGLDITRRILREAVHYLSDNGVLIVEVGNSSLALQEAYQQVAFTWLEFERGGHGVLVFSKAELEKYTNDFAT